MEVVENKDLPEAILNFKKLLCGCGQPYKCWEWLLNYLERLAEDVNLPGDFEERKKVQKPQFNTEIQTEWLAVYAVHTQCDMSTHGGSVTFSWLTENGQAALDWLQEKGTEYASDMIINYSD